MTARKYPYAAGSVVSRIAGGGGGPGNGNGGGNGGPNGGGGGGGGNNGNNGGGGGVPVTFDHFSVMSYAPNNTFPRSVVTGVDLREGALWVKASGLSSLNFAFPNVIGSSFVYDAMTSSGAAGAPGFAGLIDGFTAVANTDLGAVLNGGTSGTRVIWSFKRKTKFMDVVRYVGNGANRLLSHSLGAVPGLVMVKRHATTGSWAAGHRGLTSWGHAIVLNVATGEISDTSYFNSIAPSLTQFSLGTQSRVNTSGVDYTALLFAHDTGPKGIVQCFDYVGNGDVNGPTITLGWQPRFVMVKDRNASNWWSFVNYFQSPGFVGNETVSTFAGTSNTSSLDALAMTANGFQVVTTNASFNTLSETYIGLAIR